MNSRSKTRIGGNIVYGEGWISRFFLSFSLVVQPLLLLINDVLFLANGEWETREDEERVEKQRDSDDPIWEWHFTIAWLLWRPGLFICPFIFIFIRYLSFICVSLVRYHWWLSWTCQFSCTNLTLLQRLSLVFASLSRQFRPYGTTS